MQTQSCPTAIRLFSASAAMINGIFLQKIRFKPSEHLDLQYSFTYAGTGDAPRYDRLTQYRNGSLRFAEWHYGPMLWRMHSLQALYNKKSPIYDEVRLVIGYQKCRMGVPTVGQLAIEREYFKRLPDAECG